MAVITDTETGRQVLGEFQEAVKDVRAWTQKQENEVKQFGAAMTETKEKLATAMKQLEDLGTKAVDTAKEIQKHDEELKRLRQIGFRLGAGGGPTDGGPDLRSLGERFTQSAEYKGSQFTGRFKVSSVVGGRLLDRKATTPPAPVTITEAGSGMVIYPERVGYFLVPPQLPLVMRDLLTVIPLSGTNAVEYVKETTNIAADYQIAEGDKKAQGDISYTDDTAVVRTIAAYVKVSRQMLADVPYVAQTIDQRLLYAVMRKEEHEILYGDGATGHLKGIIPQAPALPAAPLGTPATYKIDAVIESIVYLSSLGYPPTAVVMNPLDFGSMLIAKDSADRYLLAPWGGLSQVPSTIFGVRMVQSVEIAAGTMLTGAFAGNAALFDREAANVEISFENEDDFIRNLATIRAEERIALAVFVPEAFVVASIAGLTRGAAVPGSPAHTGAAPQHKPQGK